MVIAQTVVRVTSVHANLYSYNACIPILLSQACFYTASKVFECQISCQTGFGIVGMTQKRFPRYLLQPCISLQPCVRVSSYSALILLSILHHRAFL